MNRYHVFAGDTYYPQAGKGNYKASFDEYDEAKEFVDSEGLLEKEDWTCILWDDGYKLHEAGYWRT